MPRSGVIGLVDGTVQRGQSLGALDHLLGGNLPVSAFDVALTDGLPCEDACRPRRFTVNCNDTTGSLAVSLARGR